MIQNQGYLLEMKFQAGLYSLYVCSSFRYQLES